LKKYFNEEVIRKFVKIVNENGAIDKPIKDYWYQLTNFFGKQCNQKL